MGLADRDWGNPDLFDGTGACTGGSWRLDVLHRWLGLSTTTQRAVAIGKSGPGPELHGNSNLVVGSSSWIGFAAVLVDVWPVVAATSGFQRRTFRLPSRNLGDASLRTGALGRKSRTPTPLVSPAVADAGLSRWPCSDHSRHGDQSGLAKPVAIESRSWESQLGMAIDVEPLAVSSAAQWRRTKSRCTDVRPFERWPTINCAEPRLGGRDRIPSLSLLAMHLAMATCIPIHTADRTSLSPGQPAVSFKHVPHAGASLQPASRGTGCGGIH